MSRRADSRRLALLLAACAALVLAGCAGLDVQYVEADRLTHTAIAPEYRLYVERDTALTPEQKKRRYRTLEAWADRLATTRPRAGKEEEKK